MRQPSNEQPTRREFLRTAAIAAAGATGIGSALALPGDLAPQTSMSHVVRVASEQLVSAKVVQPLLLRKGLGVGICALTKKDDPRDAWHSLLKPDDVVLIKFNQSGVETLGTTPHMAFELVRSLEQAGIPPTQVMLLESHTAGIAMPRTRPADLRWPAAQVRFRSCGADSMIAALEEATAIINVPFLKTHHLAVMSGCMKNLSHGLIQHPARFHANGCDPAIAEIVSSDPIRSKLRLNIMNAMRVVYDRGPEARESDIHEVGAVLFSRDPVACDSVGFGILNASRAIRKLDPLLPGARIPPQLASATGLGLGNADKDLIRLVNYDL